MEKGESRFQRIYVPVANARGDYLPKIANAISQNRAVVCVLAGVSVSPRNTSITYPRCRYVGKENRVSQGQFELRCVGSGKSSRVGALNVLRAGHALACAETSRGLEASGQEATDAFSQDF